MKYNLKILLLDFVNGEYDMLVTTTIIETGVDIPNANTLFVEAADYMGLSQLYQLRGRVGRSNRIAYAYFMYDPDKQLSEVSEKRLDAIKGFTELGSGFKIAMRDLSIRGAGNLLGAEQSGFIESVGFDLYSQLLEESVNSRLGRGNTKKQVMLKLTLVLTHSFQAIISLTKDKKLRFTNAYVKLIAENTMKTFKMSLLTVLEEYPDAVAFLLEIGLLKYYADNALVDRMLKQNDTIVYTMSMAAKNVYLPQDYFDALSKTDLPVKLGEESGVMVLRFDIKNRSDANYLSELISFTERLSEIRDEKDSLKKVSQEENELEETSEDGND